MKIFIIIMLILGMCGCHNNINRIDNNLVDPKGMTLKTRIKEPRGYKRVEENEFISFIRDYPLKEDGSPVLLYNGTKKTNQTNHIAIFKLPIENEDLQQCADSIMRMFAEYYYHNKQYDKISFHFVDGFQADYKKWLEGYRIKFIDGKATWYKESSYDDSYETFKKYMRIVFAYSSTLSLYDESYSINTEDIMIGDIFLKAGSPGHVIMVVDMCINNDGKKAFLLAQGYMPAQEFHIIKNPRHGDPWYYEQEVKYPFKTAEYTFNEDSLRRLKYIK